MINDFYSLGLRHAVDAGQIAAIDNVTRKLMPEDKKPISVGCFFSLGHSTIVVLMSIGIALGASFIEINLMGWKQGELAIVFTDAFKHLFSLLSNFFKWIHETTF